MVSVVFGWRPGPKQKGDGVVPVDNEVVDFGVDGSSDVPGDMRMTK